MNLLLLDKEEVQDARVTLRDHRAKHIIKILHCDVGDSVRTGVIDGDMGSGQILRIEKKYPFLVELVLTLCPTTVKKPVLDLLLALPRPIMLKRVLSQVTALGVGQIYIINAGRVEKSFWNSSMLDPEECRQHLLRGLEQAMDTRLPDISFYRHFRSFTEGKFPEIAQNYCHLLMAHPKAEKSLSALVENSAGRMLYAIGPEGGWLDFELECFKKAGMQAFSLGNRILKVDTAAVAVHSRIMQVLDR